MGDVREVPPLSLPRLGVTFTSEQLEYLNAYFTKLEELSNSVLNSYYETMTPSGGGPNLLGMDTPGSIEATIERLVQRLVTNVGILDSRFTSKYILPTGSTYEHYKINLPDEFDFMVRLDQLSCPRLDKQRGMTSCVFTDGPEDVPEGFAQVRLTKDGREGEEWAEFTDEQGYLLPHKIRRRFCELVRWAVKSTPVDMANIDETRLPGGSGKVLDVGILSDILQLDPAEHVYVRIGDADQDVFPASRDFSIKVSEDGPAVRLDIIAPACEEMPQEQKVSVDLTLSIGHDGWPSMCDFPHRISHYHVDAINCYRAAQKGWYVVCTGPHETTKCKKRQTLWRISHSPAEMELMTHYDHASVPAKVMRVCKILTGILSNPASFENMGPLFRTLIENIDTKKLQVVSSYVLKTLFLFELEEFTQVEDWLECRVSLRVLSIINALLTALEKSQLRSYFFSKANMLLKKGIEISACSSDSESLLSLVKLLHKLSADQELTIADMELRQSQKLGLSIAFENDLATLWRNKAMVQSVDSPPTTEGFTERQLQYLGSVYHMVSEYSKRRYPESGTFLSTITNELSEASNILKKFYSKMGFEAVSRVLFIIQKQTGIASTTNDQPTKTFCTLLSSAVFKELQYHSSEDKWSKKLIPERVLGILGRVLLSENIQDQPITDIIKHYLLNTYLSSWKNGWFNEDIQQQLEPRELKYLKNFVRRSLDGSNAQTELMAAVERGDEWATVLAEDLRVLGSIKFDFTPGTKVQVTHHVERFPFEQENRDTSVTEEEALLADLADRFPAVVCGCAGPTARTIHCKLQTDNPLRAVLDQTRRYGHHRVPGSLPNGLLRAGLRAQLNTIRAQHSHHV